MTVADSPTLPCVCVGKHLPRPVKCEPWWIVPLEWGGEDVEENRVWVCPTTRANLVLAWEIMAEKGVRARMPSSMSNYAVRVAREGYRRWRAPRIRAQVEKG